MAPVNEQVKRFATFILDAEKPIEFAIRAEHVLEATPITGTIQPLPAGVKYLEGFMHLRDDTIPVINMKKRLGWPQTGYTTGAKVAVVRFSQLRIGLLFDDIKDVLMVGSRSVDAINPALQTADGIISDLIKLDNGQRTMELLDLKRLLGNHGGDARFQQADEAFSQIKTSVDRKVSRYVVFSCLHQDYGVPVEQVQEITFLSKIDDTYENDSIEGAVQLRGHSIPVLNSARLFQQQPKNFESGEDTRILVLNADEFQYGLIVDKIIEIICIAEEEILPLPRSGHNSVSGIYQRSNGKNIVLVRVHRLIEGQQSQLLSVARLKSTHEDERSNPDHIQSHHLITADCYLVFSIGRKFAIELNDVQEIIEARELMDLPAATGFDRRVLNLRGRVIPVINLRSFYAYPDDCLDREDTKLIISSSKGRIVALEVDRILTIHKQVKSQKTPSLNPQLSRREDTLDRLIEFVGDSGVQEHVLVINVSAMMDNHLGLFSDESINISKIHTKENTNDHDGTRPSEKQSI